MDINSLTTVDVPDFFDVMQNAVSYIRTVNIDSPADTTLPMFEIPYKNNTLTSMAQVPGSAFDKNGWIDLENDVWWPVVESTLKEPEYFSWIKDEWEYSVATRINNLYTLLALTIIPGQAVPSAVSIGKTMLSQFPAIQDEYVAMITCAFYNPNQASDKKEIGNLCDDWNAQLSKMNAWTPPDFDSIQLSSYVFKSTSWSDEWDMDGLAPDWQEYTDANYTNTFKQVLESLTKNGEGPEQDIKEFSTFAGCYFYEAGLDPSKMAFQTCRDNMESGYAYAQLAFDTAGDAGYYSADDSDGTYSAGGDEDVTPSQLDNPVNTNDKFVADLMAFWDTYLVYNDDDFAEYLYEFPTFVAQKQTEAAYGVENIDVWNVTDDTHQSADKTANSTASAYDDYYGGYGMEEIQDLLDSLLEAYGMDDDEEPQKAPSHGKRHAKAAKGKRGGK